jgi:hypothetical protein
MAGVSLGIPIVSNEGRSTERLWRESDAIQLAALPPVEAFMQVTENLLGNAGRRKTLGENAAALYDRRFALIHTIRELRRQEFTIAGLSPTR